MVNVTTSAPSSEQYQELVSTLKSRYKQLPPNAPVRLSKKTSNLFRTRDKSESPGLDVGGFVGVINVDVENQTADVLGMTTYEDLVDATLPFGLMPYVVPQLKTITLGGAVTGLGIESSAFRLGLPHESVLEMDILLGSGEVLTVTGADEDPNRDLFYGFPNSYGSLGYALRIKIELTPVKPFVLLQHVRLDSSAAMTEAIGRIVSSREFEGQSVDFLDGTVFTPDEQYLTLGTWAENLPAGVGHASDYKGMEIYYKSIQAKTQDVLSVRDYIWRWDTDWFWCSRAFGAQRPMVRKFWPKSKLRSDVYWKIIALDRRYDLFQRWHKLRKAPLQEEVVQDIEVPLDRLPEFLDFFHQKIGISPIWVCPLASRDGQTRWPLYDMDPKTVYVNVGFWSTVDLPSGVDPKAGELNRAIERRVTELGGHKSLYSSAYYSEDEFYSLYGGGKYSSLKEKYDSQGRLLSLFDKVVGRK